MSRAVIFELDCLNTQFNLIGGSHCEREAVFPDVNLTAMLSLGDLLDQLQQ